MKLVIMEEIKNAEPDVKKIKETLTKIKARGLKQRIKKKCMAAGVKFSWINTLTIKCWQFVFISDKSDILTYIFD